jgi:hypothetical protein
MRRSPTPLLRRIATRVPLVLRRSLFAVSLAVGSLSLLIAAAPVAADSSPTASYTITGLVGNNGWYRGNGGSDYVVLHWSIQNPGQIDHTVGCEAAIRVDGPTKGDTRSCTAFLIGGGSVEWKTNPIKIDADAPSGLTAHITRSADVNGWYNHPVQVTWTGSDGISGLAGCSTVNFSGPDGAGASVSGGCSDNAGNAASSPIAINYDATAPTLSKVGVASRAASALVHWQSTSPADTIVVHRSARGNKADPTVFRGAASSFADKKIQRGLEYVYSLQSYDQAGNASKVVSAVALPKVLTLRKTPYTPRAAANPVLRWDAIRGATYYHVQLFRGKKRILAAWPSTNELTLPAAWRWAGHHYKLGPARYRWYVWEGIGKRSFARYRTLGSAAFIVPKR